MAEANHPGVNHTMQQRAPESTPGKCQVVIKMPDCMGTMCRTVNVSDSPVEWVPAVQDLRMQGWKVRMNGKAVEWHLPCNLEIGSINFCVFTAYPLKRGAAGMTAEQNMDHMLQMMSQTQTEMRQGQSEVRADMVAMYGEQQNIRGELNIIRDEQIEANKKTT